ncbi:hypothetical protein [Gluconobacter kanchanaburiensis]|uniref:Uncharacterized protein n=1 Tax=Gluconobacter kanchanaburiensis NBRC 103587 TaxID=1307948 RepID=A0A511B6Q1_9PROT|nr:hypothetical protein [Gluconobacter kanchanaburiensis]MBF0861714.1 hypothetical protein [Gluconobacter kanchanaburiensis]GBR67294.1 hypothetical protein AA103587_0213 [Gluconobacter kanchanaburiensis NBRC 103587]GEK95363.1 hypothetical protein GKA01_05600 [Gluconobacter kanchanaburiensis NBRC 103587]
MNFCTDPADGNNNLIADGIAVADNGPDHLRVAPDRNWFPEAQPGDNTSKDC